MILNQNTQNNAFTNLYTIGRSTNYQNQNPAPPAVTPASAATHIFDLIQNLNKGMYYPGNRIYGINTKHTHVYI